MKKSKLLLTILAVIMAAGMVIAPALAYFTTTAEASGTAVIALADQTKIEEPDVDVNETEWVKHVVITNEGPADCFVRAKAFAGGELTLNCGGDGWSDGGDGYWYYGAKGSETILKAGEDTAELKVTITGISEITKEKMEGDGLNVAVVYESTKVLYKEDGTPDDADWNLAVKGGEE
jgi:hypothetical protein